MKALIILAIAFASLSANAQNIQELNTINQRAKNPFAKAEDMDRLVISLRPYDDAKFAGKDTLLMDTYKAIANGYSLNNHFRQAYEIYRHYLSIKEKQLLLKKSADILSAQKSVIERKDNEQNNLMSLKNSIEELKIDVDILKNKESFFKRYSSFGLIILTALFAAMLVSSGIKMASFKNQLKQNRSKMKEIQRQSAVGNISEGIRLSTMNTLVQLENSIKELSSIDNAKKESVLKKIKEVKSRLAG